MSAVMSRAIGVNVAEALRLVRPVHTAKTVANEVGAEIPTVKRWLAGNAPGAGHLAALFAKYGPAFAARVLRPCGDWTLLLSLESELDHIQERAERVIATAKALKGKANDEVSSPSRSDLGAGWDDLRKDSPLGIVALSPARLDVSGASGLASGKGGSR